MKWTLKTAIFCVILPLMGCSSLVDSLSDRFSKIIKTKNIGKSQSLAFEHAVNANTDKNICNNIFKSTANILSSDKGVKSKIIENNRVIKFSLGKNLFENEFTKLIIYNATASTYGLDAANTNSSVKPEIKEREIYAFTRLLAEFMFSSGGVISKIMRTNVSPSGGNESELRESRRRQQFINAIILYLDKYLKGKFVDRFGNEIEKPDFKNGVTGATVAGFVRVLTEVIFEFIQMENIYVEKIINVDNGGGLDLKKMKYFPKGNSTVPSVVYLTKDIVTIKAVVANDDTERGVTEKETKLVRFVSNLAAQQSVVLAGGFLDFLGSVHVSFVIGGNFSVGDNETFRLAAKSAIETVTRRMVQSVAYNAAERCKLGNLPLINLLIKE